jgi:hypothetical protein
MYGYMTGMGSPLGTHSLTHLLTHLLTHSLTHSGRAQSPIMSLATSLPFGLLQKQLSDSIMKLLPFTNKKSIEPTTYIEEDRRSSFGSNKSISRNSTPPPTSIEVGGGASTRSSLSSVTPSPYTKVIGDKQVYEGVDRPPMVVTHLLDMFYPSKLQQIFFLGMFSLRNESELFDDATVPSYATVARANDPSEVFNQVQLPSPYDVSTLYLPSRSYSFRLLGRVIQKLVETTNESEKNWSLGTHSLTYSLTHLTTYSLTHSAFQDASTASDETFHESLLTILRKCPQIVSLSFNNRYSLTHLTIYLLAHLTIYSLTHSLT